MTLSETRGLGQLRGCYDLAKQLSHYLYLLFFFFWTYYTERSAEKCYITSVTSHSHMIGCHMVTSHHITSHMMSVGR